VVVAVVVVLSVVDREVLVEELTLLVQEDAELLAKEM
tara:strand:+ start:365 stop:475 length:111 start_codon:yes stop_codon:yes gene_type:complete